jgi:ADP-heptose:LPS heptosyltransferase
VNFGDTADVIVELDVVVAVDTAVAHLAGSLGVPTFLLLPLSSDSRWGVGDRTPWYPSMRLVRQSATDDWAPVVRQLQGLLDELRPLHGAAVANDADLQPRVRSATY